MFPPEIQRIISTYLILGVIPLDKVLHLVVGAAAAIALRGAGRSFRTVFLLTAGLALGKEAIDAFTLNSSLAEQGLDVAVTLAYPTLMYGIHRLKGALAHSK
jgi:hypothetical protein